MKKIAFKHKFSGTIFTYTELIQMYEKSPYIDINQNAPKWWQNEDPINIKVHLKDIPFSDHWECIIIDK